MNSMDQDTLFGSQYKIARMNADIAEKLLAKALKDMQDGDCFSCIKLFTNSIKCSRAAIDYCRDKKNFEKLGEMHRNAVSIYVAGRLNRGKILAKINLYDLAFKDLHFVISGCDEQKLIGEAYEATSLMVEDICDQYDNPEDGEIKAELSKLRAYVESELI